MECGVGVALCGVLAVQTGLGSGKYHHDTPGLHGLWPQISPYGSSECVPVGDASALEQVSYCYVEEGDLGFQEHEWGKHGVCSGTKDANDFFGQICSLATAPLAVMAQARSAGADLGAINASVVEAGYEVFEVDDSHSQLYLSVCAGNDGKWLLAHVADFPSVCPWSGPLPTPTPHPSPHPSPRPSPSPSPSGSQCEPNRRGPACSEDSDCSGQDCVRCAHSGFCTEVPLAQATLV